MRITKQSIGKTFARVTLLLTLSILANLSVVRGQTGATQPERGAQIGNAFSRGQFDTVNTTNGNLMLNFSLGSLPPGRGSATVGLSLTYNSKLYDSRVLKIKDEAYPCTFDKNGLEQCTYYYKTIIEPSDKGGWRTSSQYQLEFENRMNSYVGKPPTCSINGAPFQDWAKQTYIHKLRIVGPDGSSHEMHPRGYTDYPELLDKFYRVTPDGWVESCGLSRYRTNSAMSYYSDDGSYLRLDFSYDNDADFSNNTWTLNFPDGSKITGTGTYAQRVYDRNGNYVDGLTDQFGRSIYKGVNGADLLWNVTEKQIRTVKTYQSCPEGYGQGQCPQTEWRSNLIVDRTVVDTITEPAAMGGRTYTFSYNGHPSPNTPPGSSYGWGEVSGVTISNGPSITYSYNMDGMEGAGTGNDTDIKDILGNFPTAKALTHDGVTDTWGYNTSRTSGGSSEPDGSWSTNYFYDTSPTYASWQDGLTYKTESSNGTKVEKIWQRNMPSANCESYLSFRFSCNPYVKTEYTSVKESLTGPYTISTIKDYTYDKNGNVTEVREYDWMPYSVTRGTGDDPSVTVPTGSSAYLKRKTVTSYYNGTPDASATNYTDPDMYLLASSTGLLRLPFASEVQDAGGVTKSRGEIAYDFTSYFGNTKAGNPVTTRSWDSTKASSPPSSLDDTNSVKTQATYNQYGMPLSTTDAKGNVATISYGPILGPNGYVFDLYPTQTVTASGTGVARNTTATYDFYTGVVLTSTDVDNGLTNATIYDDIGRPTKNITASGDSLLESWVRTEYDDAARRIIVRSDIEAKGDGRKVAIQHFDQLGRVRLSRTLENPTEDATNEQLGIKVESRYLTGSPTSYQLTSNPFRAPYSSAAGGEETMGWVLTSSANTGRHTETTTFAGAALPQVFGGSNTNSTGVVTTDTNANANTVTDQANKQRRSITNGLGQLIRVDEPTASGLGPVTSPNQPTAYAYDTLGNMITVQQGSQLRHFLYSSLGRMLRVRQPEQDINASLALSGHPTNSSWTAGFTYDDNGNVVTTTDAKNLTITNNTYDALNRPASRSYSDGTPTVNFYYDGNGVSPTPSFAKGKLTKVTNGILESRYTQFDVAGRLKQYQQITDGQTYTSSYLYNISGALTQETYPSGRIVNNEFETDGDLMAVRSQKSGSTVLKTYVSDFSYTASGGISQMKLGNGKWETAKFNSQNQVTELGLGSSSTDTSIWKVNYEYGELQTNGTVDPLKNTGNIARRTLTIPGSTFVQSYNYDSLDRLSQAKETIIGGSQSWIQNFGYDIYGNRTSFSQNIGGNTTATNPSVNSATNRFNVGQGFVYDANGNVVQDIDPITGHARQFVFDGDNKQTQVIDTNTSTTKGTYFYDGEGKRIKKVTETETTIFVYSAGKLVAEYSTNVAPPAEAKVAYTTTDHLGSPRVITDDNGQIITRRDFLPFGEDINPGIGGRTGNGGQGYLSANDKLRQKFTGYQKDTETSLDFAEARMYENRIGRFTAVDPLIASGRSSEPQTFNRYVYVGNSPLVVTDPAGLDWYQQDSGDRTKYKWFDGEADEGWIAVDFGAAGNRYKRLGDARLDDASIGAIYLNKYGNSYLTQAEYSAMMTRGSYGATDAIADTAVGAAKWGWNGMAGVSEAFYATAGRASWEYAFTGQPRSMPSVTYFEYSNPVQANAGTAMTIVSFLAPAFRRPGVSGAFAGEGAAGTSLEYEQYAANCKRKRPLSSNAERF